MDPTALYLVVLPAALYMRASRVLAKRGYAVPPLQQACWYGALAALCVALLSPLDHLGETDLVWAHMGQHLLVIDIAAPLLVLGLRSPVYAFMLPRALLVPVATFRPLRWLFSEVRKPFVAAAIFVLTMYLWHLAPAYDAALNSPVVHGLQHQCFLLAGMIFWLPLIEPWHRRVPGGLWKIGYVFGVRLLTMFVGFALVATPDQIYGFYGERARDHGFTPLFDQQFAGTLMMIFDIVIMVGSTIFFFMRTSREDAEAGRDHPPMPSDITAEDLAAAAARERAVREPPAAPAGSGSKLG